MAQHNCRRQQTRHSYKACLVHIFPSIHIGCPAFGADHLVLVKDKHFDLVISDIGGHDAALAAFAQKQDFAVEAHRQAFATKIGRAHV